MVAIIADSSLNNWFQSLRSIVPFELHSIVRFRHRFFLILYYRIGHRSCVCHGVVLYPLSM